MRDFTIALYTKFLNVLSQQAYTFQTLSGFLKKPKEKVIILRNDVDKLPQNSLQFARIQNKMGIAGTYYFRVLPQSYNEKIIKEISELGHEIGYHYETMDTCKGNVDKAYEEFCRNLEKFREIASIVTICMHGSPFSKYDNRAIWEKYDYKKLEIIGEPYFDFDFNKVLYITDTGRRWNGNKVSIRDKVMQTSLQKQYHFKSTADIINKVDALPNQMMLTFHPQRWSNNYFEWFKELVIQSAKNQIKRVIVK
ncbi:MAG: hypothetical protein AUJ97_02170 [Bacteroidetes bacterium CG2_30_32_10]|nr:MAG: hypothetical protein AUJ97_02170 [Bacteroidetes bacterium CG2_30_32_10]